MSAVPLRRFFLLSAHIPIPPSPFPRFAFTGAAAGGGERSAACSYGTRVPAREGRSARAASELPGLSLAGQGPPPSPDPSFSLCSFSGVAFVFSPVRSGPSPRRFFCCALRSLLSGAPAAPLRCVAPRSARCLPRYFSLPSVRSVFPAPLPFSSPPCFAPYPPRRCFRPVLGACPAFLLFPVRRFSRRPRGLTG